MNELQRQRNAFREGNPGFTNSLWKKLGEEAVEAMKASWTYLRAPTEANRHHLGEELADMVFIVLDMATKHNIDLHEAMINKLQKDQLRFPPGTVMKRGDYRRRKVFLGER